MALFMLYQCGYILGNFWKKWASFYANIWSHWLRENKQITLSYLIRGWITLPLTSCVNGLDSNYEVNLLFIQHKQNSQIQTSKTRGQPNSCTSTYEVNEYSLEN